MHACCPAPCHFINPHGKNCFALSNPCLTFQECLCTREQRVAVHVLCAFSHSIPQKGEKSQLSAVTERETSGCNFVSYHVDAL